MKLIFVFALMATLLLMPVSSVEFDVGDNKEVQHRVERGFFCNPGLCYRQCKLDGYRRASCSGDDCVCV
ncbi:unnamed protein product [Tenebrio molitor]|nr:unnamed protein product [Tenebrio molitor]